MHDAVVNPLRLRLPLDTEVDVAVTNDGTVPHHFIVQRLGIHADVDPGQTVVVQVDPSRSGNFRSWCAYPGHDEQEEVIVA